MKRATVLACLLVALALPAAAEEAVAPPSADPTQVRAGHYRLDAAHGKITWSLSHLGYSTYYGQITDVAGDLSLDPKAPAQSRLSVRVATASVNALHEALNAHLRGPDFFDAERFPTATFESRAVEPTGPTTARVTGDLTLRGTTKPIVLDVTFNQAGIHPVDKTYTVGFDGRAVLRRSEFGMTAFLPALGDEVSLRLEGEFKAAP
ncbi:YceI family protein [Methylobacterium sp. WSM2598]|uniref:YceI family protein n=1 Tax=Methylobacterium sp. WSM2598 TaxID=398261 RepID=UPI00036CC6C1|nr:YceI family protein [Methylobacterium sp. WSM2598]